MDLFHNAYRHLPGNGGPADGNTLQLVGGPSITPFTEDLADGARYDWGVGDPTRAGKDQPGSWAYSALPFLEQEVAYQGGRADLAMPMFACPSRPRGGPLPPIDNALAKFGSGGMAMTKTDYCGNNRIVLNRPDCKAHRDIRDGLSQTILLGEKAFDPTVQIDSSWYWVNRFGWAAAREPHEAD